VSRDADSLSEEDMDTVYTLHCALFGGLTNCNWYCARPCKLPKLDIRQPLLLKYRVLSDMVQRWREIIGTFVWVVI